MRLGCTNRNTVNWAALFSDGNNVDTVSTGLTWNDLGGTSKEENHDIYF